MWLMDAILDSTGFPLTLQQCGPKKPAGDPEATLWRRPKTRSGRGLQAASTVQAMDKDKDDT